VLIQNEFELSMKSGDAKHEACKDNKHNSATDESNAESNPNATTSQSSGVRRSARKRNATQLDNPLRHNEKKQQKKLPKHKENDAAAEEADEPLNDANVQSGAKNQAAAISNINIDMDAACAFSAGLIQRLFPKRT
jgi:hypothetical protein